MSSKYETVVGLEVHTELKTNSKIFCGCTTEFGGAQNTHVCPVCLGLPGVLPVLNKKVVEYAIKVGLALNCEILHFNKFDRKNYYYPDLPKNWQTSQYDLPICLNGHLDVEVNGETRRIRITRIHMEEDAGKLVHSGNTISDSNSSNVDYNRTGVPLLEIVSEPDIRSGAEAKAYVEKLRSILQYLDVTDARMEEGSLRCDANISVRLRGTEKLGTKSEIKNMNTLTGIQKGIEYEALRQAMLIEEGGQVIQETRTWDDAQGITLSMRKKEAENDYRYFPEPDLVPIIITDEEIEAVRAELPELPDQKMDRFVNQYGLSVEDSTILTSTRQMADYLDATVNAGSDAKTASNWILGDLSKMVNENGLTFGESKVTAENLAGMIALMDKGTISGKIAKKVIVSMWESGKDADTIVKEEGLVQITDTGAIEEIVKQVIANNPQPVEDFKSGNGKAIGFLVGQVMKESKGRANPGVVNQLLQKHLND
ncbi:MAG: Asp-tRNA(Asn)/Glu-tRNA(Gln) amidotransferase subunit GatB [Veillonella sp.]|jgi:aspartyl-tRNA(Asn)/glutamyl-tRNA(Gln) amidotransferase subunit B|uniref:Asp-tRNA(Asn)/Glu-tRNA(Gln) amidotransferase subunit GatB n=1 Tax=Veillonella sp. TaxID=1926307 RepID=UPI001B4A4271|nr:Asp-tRNA(Asn)/Glu-tRNA(Gln) amidotransferase subunit GatB [Veillonella sp.]MBP6922605.1 Asp-tRNA(Asn)/Glu-tRNA(Gln) amidotransferase subunit GatB [Veillonella sp.]MBP8616284.1 Asp-tRNA(Asn)/Glu-tRNA(Gln) amidotransferase subunit GatB [Veillonella sp.]MBP9516604.1 Asp-tRNA(Asn)/Glu-tRNA(Gln) amidotransferase subunit GatB [Veillonella sp.]MBP9550451.1 Asp-tRNA(Asn)/Glu-tRNA(Gln) amidotransferase subunit GatB [Veillonella sp.]